MEGISDGTAIDSCGLCGLLDPDAYSDGTACPRCAQALRYVPAKIIGPIEIPSDLDTLSMQDIFKLADELHEQTTVLPSSVSAHALARLKAAYQSRHNSESH